MNYLCRSVESNVPVVLAAFVVLVGAALAEVLSLDLHGAAALPLALSTVSAPVTAPLRRRRGRPRKFAAPSRAVTLTLPEAVIAALGRIDRDLSHAIVRLTRRRVPRNGTGNGNGNGTPAAELSVFGRRAVITVEPRQTLAARTGIELVPLPDGRALIAFEHPLSISDLELLLHDGLEDPALPEQDRKVFESVRDILREARRSNDLTLLQRSIIVLERSKRPGRNTAAAVPRPSKSR